MSHEGKGVSMKVLKIGFVGTRTDRPEAMADFFERVLGLRPTHRGDDMWAFELPDGGIAEVFGPSQNDHYPSGPVVEFLVQDVEAATEELRAAGVPIVFGPVRADDVGLAWVQFRAPDGNIYGVIQSLDTRSS
jgi:catechol 2,3-dioxygenase-like lactoylglutathione lyase family enzyme